VKYKNTYPIETSERSRIQWWQSLRFQGVLVLGCAVGWLVLGIVSVMKTQGKALIMKESERFVEQTGNQATAHLNTRLDEIAAVTRTLATTSQLLPKSEEVFKQTIPPLLDFNGDLEIAGGGVWPEPFVFEPSRPRRSFFWGRNAQGKMTYYDDYNQSGAGYHNESWYVVARHLKPGVCSWSESYVDPYSLEPMVTCSVATIKNNRFTGVATIDLKMGGLADWIQRWQKDAGGYAFIVDRNNRFIAFPATDKVRKTSQDSKGKTLEEALLASQLLPKNLRFYQLRMLWKRSIKTC
jgi:two-component system, NtrC family, sensor kinase